MLAWIILVVYSCTSSTMTEQVRFSLLYKFACTDTSTCTRADTRVPFYSTGSTPVPGLRVLLVLVLVPVGVPYLTFLLMKNRTYTYNTTTYNNIRRMYY
jgi:hypothetical protein